MSMYPKNMFFTSESVTEGHPDKFCDQISDAVLDECLKIDPMSRVACECYVTMGLLNVLALGALQAVVIAFLLSTIDLLRRASRPGTWVLREAPDGSHFFPEEAGSAPDTSGLIVYRFGAPLYFANASLFEEEVEKLVTQATTPVKWLVLDVEAMVDIDTSGAEVLHQVLSKIADRGVTVALSRANDPTAALLAQYHLLDLIGENRLYPTNRHAIATYRQEHGQPGPEAGPALA